MSVRRRRRRSGGIGKLVAVLTVGGAVLLALIVGGLFAFGVFQGKVDKGGAGPLSAGSDVSSPSVSSPTASTPSVFFANGLSNNSITKGNFAKLEHAMTLEEVQAILGTGITANQDDMRTAFGNQTRSDPNDTPEEKWINNGLKAGVSDWYQWRASDFSIFVGFGKGKRTGKLKALLSFWVERVMTGAGLYGFFAGAGFLIQSFDPDQITDARDAENRLMNDPKWKKGKERDLLLGRWQNNQQFGYDFGADGTVKTVGVGKYTSTYRFIDDDHIEMNVPTFLFQPPRLQRFLVLVTKDELLLVRDDGQWRAFLDYKRIK